jgi:hypothetical protein
MADEIKDVTITSFGLLLAYFLPGLIGLYGLSFWSESLRSSFKGFLTAESSVGLFVIVILFAAIVGLLAHGVRWIIFEVWFCRENLKLEASDFEKLSAPGKMSAFRGAVDEIHRYHQWWGGVSVVGPIVFAGWASSGGHSKSAITFASIVFLAFEVLAIFAALRVQEQYVHRVKMILKG